MAAHRSIKRKTSRLIVSWAALSIVFGLAPPALHADEAAVRAALKSEAAGLLEQGDIAAYDRRAGDLRRSRERTPAGIWKSSLFYKGPDNWPAPRADAPIWTRIEAATEAYLHEHPDSAAGVVAHARMLVSHAWTWRGGGWGRDLTDSQRRGFATYLERARAVLDQYREVGSGDPEWYALRIQVMNGQNSDKTAILALAREALDHEPTYQPIDYAAANSLLPKWGGSVDLLRQFVTLAVAKSSASEGTQAYGRIMFNIARADSDPMQALMQVGAQWPVLKVSLREISAAYPDPWNLNAERAMACLMGSAADYDEALARASTSLHSVAWFDSLSPWPECQRRQERATQLPMASWAQSLVSTTPSLLMIQAFAAGAALTWALLYLSRRSRVEESPLFDSMGSPAASGGEYPRTYRMTPAWRLGIALLAGILLLACLAVAWVLGVMTADIHGAPAVLVITFIVGGLASGAVFYLVDNLKSAIVLTADRLEIHELWRVRRIPRADIESRQVLHRPNSPAVLILRLRSPNHRKIKLPIMWEMDSTWAAWFESIPDSDAEAAKAFEAAIEANADLGTTPAERQQKLDTARKVARISVAVTAVLIAWAFAYPHPYALLIAVLAALPWVAIGIMARSPGLYALNAPRGSGRPDLTLLLITPGFVLMLRALQDVRILDWPPLLLWAVVVALALMGGVLWAVPSAREKPGMVALTLALVLAYGYGVCAIGDAVLDRSSGSSYTTTVNGKHVTGGRNKRPMLRLAPWGPRTAEDNVAVPWDLYYRTNVGDEVCVQLHPGALGVPWYRVASCQF
jgi:hypothetical protein